VFDLAQANNLSSTQASSTDRTPWSFVLAVILNHSSSAHRNLRALIHQHRSPIEGSLSEQYISYGNDPLVARHRQAGAHPDTRV
jgi:hypothetical protein